MLGANASGPCFYCFNVNKFERGINGLQVLVRDNNVDQALKALKKKLQREGVFREMKLRGHFEKPSEKKAREKAEAVRRARKLARKKLQREGLLPSKPVVARGGPGGKGGPGGGRGGAGGGGFGGGAGGGGFGGGAGGYGGGAAGGGGFGGR
jgi:small subunit ribosomal protein S21